MTRPLLLLVAVGLCLGGLAPLPSVEARVESRWLGPGRGRPLAQLIPRQSCSYQGYNKVLNCNCRDIDTSATMDFELGYYIGQSGDDIREVVVTQVGTHSLILILSIFHLL